MMNLVQFIRLDRLRSDYFKIATFIIVYDIIITAIQSCSTPHRHNYVIMKEVEIYLKSIPSEIRISKSFKCCIIVLHM